MPQLYAAIRTGDAAQVQAAVDADPSLAIFAAAMRGNAARVDALLATNRSLVSSVSSDGWTPLHLAAHFGRPEAAQALVNKGADVSARPANSMNNKPLHAAAAGGSWRSPSSCWIAEQTPTGSRRAAGRRCIRPR